MKYASMVPILTNGYQSVGLGYATGMMAKTQTCSDLGRTEVMQRLNARLDSIESKLRKHTEEMREMMAAHTKEVLRRLNIEPNVFDEMLVKEKEKFASKKQVAMSEGVKLDEIGVNSGVLKRDRRHIVDMQPRNQEEAEEGMVQLSMEKTTFHHAPNLFDEMPELSHDELKEKTDSFEIRKLIEKSTDVLSDSVEKGSVIAKHNDDEQCVWGFEGGSSFIDTRDTNSENLGRATKICPHHKEDQLEYCDERRLKEVVKKHSEFITYPISLWFEKTTERELSDDEDKEEITKDAYVAFYKSLTNDSEERSVMKNISVEGRFKFKVVLFVPKRAYYDISSHHRHGLLCVPFDPGGGNLHFGLLCNSHLTRVLHVFGFRSVDIKDLGAATMVEATTMKFLESYVRVDESVFLASHKEEIEILGYDDLLLRETKSKIGKKEMDKLWGTVGARCVCVGDREFHLEKILV